MAEAGQSNGTRTTFTLRSKIDINESIVDKNKHPLAPETPSVCINFNLCLLSERKCYALMRFSFSFSERLMRCVISGFSENFCERVAGSFELFSICDVF